MKLAASLLAFGTVFLLSACGSSPTISSFTADKSAVNLGESVNLSWTVDGAESLTLNGGAVTGTSATVSPKKTTVYSLTATNGHGSVSSSPVTVTVTVQNVVKDDWTLYGPDHYSGNTLTVDVPNLGLNEHLAIIAMNLGDEDVDPSVPVPNATLTVTGTNPVFSARPAPPPVAQASAQMAVGNGPELEAKRALRERGLRGHEVVRAKEAQLLADAARRQKAGLKGGPAVTAPLYRTGVAASAAPTNTNFCVQQGVAPGSPYARKSATLKKETAHALFYLDDDDASDYAPYETGVAGDIWITLGDLWENTIYPADTQTFGAESDVDGNGKLIIFFSRELGAPDPVTQSVTLGYYSANDVLLKDFPSDYPKDTTSDCSGGGSNGADMFYMNSLYNLATTPDEAESVIADSYPDTLGHEFQHLINFNQKHLVPGDYSVAEDTWINEGLSVTAEDIIGFGWNGPGGRSDANAYLTDLAFDYSNNPFLRYFNASFSNWSGDPVGNYQGAHAFFRYFTDRMGEGILKNIVQTTQAGTDNLARVLGEPFDQAFAEWATALLFSNESNEPSTKFDFTGANWSPLHAKLTASAGCGPAFPYPNRAGYLQYETFDNGTAKAALRSLGFNVFVTNAGLNQPVTLTVTPTQSGVQPEVAVIRFSGSLPDGRQLSCN